MVRVPSFTAIIACRVIILNVLYINCHVDYYITLRKFEQRCSVNYRNMFVTQYITYLNIYRVLSKIIIFIVQSLKSLKALLKYSSHAIYFCVGSYLVWMSIDHMEKGGTEVVIVLSLPIVHPVLSFRDCSHSFCFVRI